MLRIFGALVLLAFGLGCATTQGPEVAEQVERQSKAKYNMGIDHLENGRTAMALRELLDAEQLTPNDPWVHFALAEAYRRSNRPQDSVRHLERTMLLDPGLQSARLNLSGVYVQMGDYANAARHAQILVDDPTFATPWRALTNLGWSELRMGRIAEARRHLELAIQYSPRYWPALLNLGILEGGEGRRLEAVALFQRVVDLDPGPLATAEAHYRIAETFIALGQQEKAVRHLDAVAGIQPNGQWGAKSEEYLKLLR
jgi:Tfp pilus assembly protein PilF